MRLANSDKSPIYRAEKLANNREEALSLARTQLKGFRLWLFNKAFHASVMFSKARERSKTTILDLIHVARLFSRELARRTAQQRDSSELIDLWFVLETELDEFVRNPSAFNKQITERKQVRGELSRRVPSLFFEGDLPDPSLWQLREEIDPDDFKSLKVGDSLEGFGGCPGLAEGIARVVTDPSDPGSLGTGDILIAPLTDPSWTPLFVPAEAVVVDVGGQMSHAVIVSRELGMPCVVAAANATQLIRDGSHIRVDGSSGLVTRTSD